MNDPLRVALPPDLMSAAQGKLCWRQAFYSEPATTPSNEIGTLWIALSSPKPSFFDLRLNPAPALKSREGGRRKQEGAGLGIRYGSAYVRGTAQHRAHTRS